MFVFKLFLSGLTSRMFSGGSTAWLDCCTDQLIACLLVACYERWVWVAEWVNSMISSSVRGLTVLLVAWKWLLTSFDLGLRARVWPLLHLWLRAVWLIPTYSALPYKSGAFCWSLVDQPTCFKSWVLVQGCKMGSKEWIWKKEIKSKTIWNL
jgi:hypothetical protein